MGTADAVPLQDVDNDEAAFKAPLLDASPPRSSPAKWGSLVASPKRHFMTSFDKLYVESRCEKDPDGCLIVPTKQQLKQIIDEGVSAHAIDDKVVDIGRACFGTLLSVSH
jgi:hypothetical protein